MSNVKVPHFTLPFRWVSNGGVLEAAVAEQDSDAEIIACVQGIVLYTIGERVEKPEFGIHEPVFSSPRLDEDGITEAVRRWEPRAVPRMRQSPDPEDDLITRAIISLESNRTGATDV